MATSGERSKRDTTPTAGSLSDVVLSSSGASAGPVEDAAKLRFANILAIADDAIVSVDETQCITLFNRGAERIFGYDAAEMLGQPLERLLPDRFGASHRAHVQTFAASEQSAKVMAQRGEIWGRRRDGSEFPAEASISKLRVGAGMVFTVILRDITDRKVAEAALQHAHDELEVRVRDRTAELEEKNLLLLQEIQERTLVEQRLARQAEELERSNADLEQFAYVASHDLQEPLRMVASYTRLLAKRYRGQIDENADEFITYIVDGALRMQQLINDLLAFSRIGTRGEAFQPVALSDVMGRVLRTLQAAVQENGAEVVVQPLPTVMADPLQMELLLQNLTANAIKFRSQSTPSVTVSAERDTNMWVIRVADKGIGLDMRYADRIFVIFQRLHTAAEYPGTGIGLALCKKIVERHGGRIWVESSLGKGATFCFTIPDGKENHDGTPTAPGANSAG